MKSSHDNGRTVRVLIVDDHLEMAETVSEGLNEFGFQGFVASSASEAIAAVKAGEFDALVTDLRIPGTDGLELLALSRDASPERPVIVMTAFSGIDTAVESIRRGAYHYMMKPFKVAELALFLNRALEESALRREAKVLRTALHKSIDKIVGRSPQMLDISCKLCVAGGEGVPTQSRCMEARDSDDDNDDDEPQRPVGRPPMRSMLLRNMGGRS